MKLTIRNTLSVAYRLLIGLPVMFIGYLRDRLSRLKNSNDPVCDDLQRAGLHIFARLPAQDVAALVADFEAIKSTRTIEKNGQLNGRIAASGVLTPLLGRYAENMLRHAQAMLNTEKVKIEISYYQESFPVAVLDDIPGGEFHVDDNKANLKFFIYLTDVFDFNGPFSCVPATGSWKLKGSLWRGALWELTKQRKYLYEYKIQRERCVRDEQKILGPSGTCFFVDTTGLHRAQPVVAGTRQVAVISFNRAGLLAAM